MITWSSLTACRARDEGEEHHEETYHRECVHDARRDGEVVALLCTPPRGQQTRHRPAAPGNPLPLAALPAPARYSSSKLVRVCRIYMIIPSNRNHSNA